MKNLISIAILTLIFSVLTQAQSLQKFKPDSSDERIHLLQKEINLLDDDHCEVPCGIYGDSLRIDLLKEHSATIEKGMIQINKLSGEEKPDYNQIVRWVITKESHAEQIQHVVSQYFLHQRIKLLPENPTKQAKEKYRQQLVNLHSILVYAMKTKQSTDLKNVKNLNQAIHDFEHSYFEGHKH